MPDVLKQDGLKPDTSEWTSLSYSQLVQSLGSLTHIGVFEEGSLAMALAVARLVDRGRILRSELRASDLRRMLRLYRAGSGWRPIPAIERALEQAILIAEETADRARQAELENETEAAANAAR